MKELATSELIQILGPDGSIVGTGFLISEETAVTCTHVLAPIGSVIPGEASIRFYGRMEPHKVVIERKYSRPAEAEDIVFLTLVPPVRSNVPLHFGSSDGTNGHEFETFGFPTVNPDGGIRGDGHVVGKVTINQIPVLQIDSKQVSPGFSGAPVMDKLTGLVIGMITKIAIPDEYAGLRDVAFITPSEQLREVFPGLQIEHASLHRMNSVRRSGRSSQRRSPSSSFAVAKVEHEAKALLQWLVTNLDMQIDDMNLEAQGSSIECYWDTTDVWATLLGVDFFYPLGKFVKNSFDDASALVRCLADGGWFGPIRMLPPHQAEILRLIQTAKHEESSRNDGLSARAQRFLIDAGLRGTIGKSLLLKELTKPQVQEIVRSQAGDAATFYKALQSLRGTWRARLQRWITSDMLSIEKGLANYSELLESPEFGILQDAFAEVRPEVPLNNFADALALTLLMGLLDNKNNGGECPRMPRFFSSSPLFYDVVRKCGLDEQLSYDTAHGQRVSVLRNADYYIFKATFGRRPKELGPDDGAYSQHRRDVVRLRDLARQALEAALPATTETLDRLEVGGKPLRTIIDDLKSFSFLENVWLPVAAASQVLVMREYIEVAEMYGVELRHEIDAAIVRAETELADAARLYVRARDLFRRFRELSRTLNGHIGQMPSSTDLFAAFGLDTFGFPESLHHRIDTALRDTASNDPKRNASVFSLVFAALNMVAKTGRELDDTAIASVVMWSIQWDDELIELLSRADKFSHFSLKLLYARVLLRSGRIASPSNGAFLQLEEELSKEKWPNNRSDLAGGLADLYFCMFRQLRDKAIDPFFTEVEPTMDTTEPSNAKLLSAAINYAEMSYVAASGISGHREVFALNRFLYYSLWETNALDRTRIRSLASRLIEFLVTSEWQYQFDDTLARYFHLCATRASDPADALRFYQMAKRHIQRAIDSCQWNDTKVRYYERLLRGVQSSTV